MHSITPEALHAQRAQHPVQIVDVRSPAEFARGRAAGAVNVPLERLSAAALQGFDLHAPVYVICKSGMRSLMGVQRLRHEGVATVVNVAGGTDAWMWAGLPVESDHAGSRLG